MNGLSRRTFLASSMGLLSSSSLGLAASHGSLTALYIDSRVIEVNGKAAKVFGLIQPNGTHGLVMNAGDRFRVRLTNKIADPTLIHWHGLTPPNAQDGVPGVTQAPLTAAASYDYDFLVAKPGTNWMHSHLRLQEQQLMAAPLIVRDPAEAGLDEQEVVVMLHDFLDRDPEQILAELSKGMDHGAMDQGQMNQGQMDHSQMNHSQMGHDMGGGMSMGGMAMAGMDLNDVTFDAYLANDRTLVDPEVVRVERGGKVRLRIINAASSTNFMLDLGDLDGELIAVDGRPIAPIRGRRFPLAMAQRADIRLALPREGGAWPILAQREGDAIRTGIILASSGASIGKVSETASKAIGAIEHEVPLQLQAAEPLPDRRADQRIVVDLTGSMMSYQWGIQSGMGHHIEISEGERVELELVNKTDMSHPMHLHGHHFQIVEINGTRVNGAVRDTELVPQNGRVVIAFDADNPGKWMFHCHNLYHMERGMMTQVRYG